MTLRAAAVGGITWSALDRISRVLLSFLVFTALARLLRPADFGLVALASIYISLLEVFVTQGLGTVLIQRVEVTSSHLDTAFWVSFVAALFVAVLTVVLAPLGARLFSTPDLTLVLRALALLVPFSALGIVPVAILSREMAFDRLAIRSVASAVLGGASGVAAAWAGWGVWALVIQSVVFGVSGTVAVWLSTPWRPGRRVSRTALADLWRLGAALTANDLLWFFSRKGDETVVAYGLGTLALGSYSVANRLLTILVDVLTSPIQTVALPMMSRLQQDKRQLAKGIVEGSIWSAAVGWPTFVGLFVIAPTLVPLLFGPKWIAATPILQVLCVAGLVRVASVMHHPALLAINRPWTYFALFALHAVLTVAASAIAALTGRAEWVAVSQAVAYTVTGIANFTVLFRATEFSVARLVAGWATVAVPCALMAGIVIVLTSTLQSHQFPLPVVLVGSVVAGVFSYALMMLVTMRSMLTTALAVVKARAKR